MQCADGHSALAGRGGNRGGCFANCEEISDHPRLEGSAAEKTATSQGVNFAADQEISTRSMPRRMAILSAAAMKTRYCWCFRLCITELPVVGTAENAFANCKYLQEVRVEAESVYLQVVTASTVMDATGKTLLLYPARRAGADLVIDETVTAIADYAFTPIANICAVSPMARRWRRLATMRLTR